MSATLMPRIEDLMNRLAPYHIKVDLNQDFNTAQNGNYEYDICY